jgi:hypothetical protein
MRHVRFLHPGPPPQAGKGIEAKFHVNDIPERSSTMIHPSQARMSSGIFRPARLAGALRARIRQSETSVFPFEIQARAGQAFEYGADRGG